MDEEEAPEEQGPFAGKSAWEIFKEISTFGLALYGAVCLGGKISKVLTK
jgi:hypothetical protein